MRLKNINKILFITLSNIGDVILTLPVLSALKDRFPCAGIDVVVGPRPKDVFAKDPRINRIFIYDKHAGLRQKIELINKLRKEKYDLAVDMRTSAVPFLIGARYRSGLISSRKARNKHRRLVHLDKLRPFGIEYRRQKNIYIDDKDRDTIEKLLGESGVGKDDVLIGVSPVSRGTLKRWHTEGFIEVIDTLVKKRDCKVLLVGDTTQTDIARHIKNAIAHDGLLDLTGRTNLNELCALIERMRVLLTCDSAAMHIACDLGVKVVAIFGPTDPEEYGPTGEDDIVIRKELACSPCRKAVCSFTHECMEQIKAGEVLEAVEELT